MTVSTKKIRLTLMKSRTKLHVTLHACKGNALVSAKEERASRSICVFASNQAWVWVWVCIACLSLSTQSLVGSYLCVYVMAMFVEVLKGPFSSKI